MAFDPNLQSSPLPPQSPRDRFLADVRVSQKLNLMLAAMTVGIVAVFAFAIQGLVTIHNQHQRNFMYISAPITALNDAAIALDELQAELILLQNPALSAEEKSAHLEKIKNAEQIVALTLQKYETDWLAPVDLTLNAGVYQVRKAEIQQTLDGLYKNESALFVQFKSMYSAYDTEAGPFYENIKNGSYDDQARDRISNSLGAIQTLTRQLISIHDERLQLANETEQASYQNIVIRMIFALVLAAILSFLFASSIARSINSRLTALDDNASGLEYELLDLRATVSIFGNDEIAHISRSFEVMFRRLRTTLSDLKIKVDENTASLAAITAERDKRTHQFQAVSQVTQKVTTERELDTLLSIITEIIANQFKYQHVAIYLNDDAQEFTTLNAASSEEGRRLMEDGYKLPIAFTNLIGYAAKTGNSRANTDANVEANINDTRLSTAIRSEIALPLKAGSQILGVLDVQSDRENAFDQIDVEALTALTNQITIATQNARLFNETQTALAESQLLYGTVIKQAWETNIRTISQIGYRYSGVKAVPLEKPLNSPEMLEALDSGYFAFTHPSKRKSENALAVPLKLRNKTIGVINIKMPVDIELAEDETDIITAVAQRISLALESASLLEESQRRAMREQNISEMSAKIGTGTDVETILQTAIRELGNQISGAQIMIEIGSEDNE